MSCSLLWDFTAFVWLKEADLSLQSLFLKSMPSDLSNQGNSQYVIIFGLRPKKMARESSKFEIMDEKFCLF